MDEGIECLQVICSQELPLFWAVLFFEIEIKGQSVYTDGDGGSIHL